MTLEEQKIHYIDLCLTFAGTYEDYPFDDANWALIRHSGTKRTFACIYERNGMIWLNLKCEPMQAEFWRGVYASVIPAYHMNKVHWNSVIIDGSVPEEDILTMISESYELTAKKKK